MTSGIDSLTGWLDANPEPVDTIPRGEHHVK